MVAIIINSASWVHGAEELSRSPSLISPLVIMSSKGKKGEKAKWGNVLVMMAVNPPKETHD